MQYSEYPILKIVMLVCKVKHRSEALRIFATQYAVGLKCVPQLDVDSMLMWQNVFLRILQKTFAKFR